MAAISIDRPSRLGTGYPDAGICAASRSDRRRWAAIAERLRAAKTLGVECLLLLWMLGVVAFSLLITAGVLGLLA